MNCGHAVFVKLLPRPESNTDGRGELESVVSEVSMLVGTELDDFVVLEGGVLPVVLGGAKISVGSASSEEEVFAGGETVVLVDFVVDVWWLSPNRSCLLRRNDPSSE